jgi:hypothetical protein
MSRKILYKVLLILGVAMHEMCIYCVSIDVVTNQFEKKRIQ